MEEEVVETLYGKTSKYEVVRHPRAGGFLRTEFYVLRDGKSFSGPYNDLRDAVEKAEKESGTKR